MKHICAGMSQAEFRDRKTKKQTLDQSTCTNSEQNGSLRGQHVDKVSMSNSAAFNMGGVAGLFYRRPVSKKTVHILFKPVLKTLVPPKQQYKMLRAIKK